VQVTNRCNMKCPFGDFCIEKIEQPAGNVRTEPLPAILARLAAADAGNDCQQCWTLCRGTAQALGPGLTLGDWADLVGM
jgi:hypothetical protein